MPISSVSVFPSVCGAAMRSAANAGIIGQCHIEFSFDENLFDEYARLVAQQWFSARAICRTRYLVLHAGGAAGRYGDDDVSADLPRPVMLRYEDKFRRCEFYANGDTAALPSFILSDDSALAFLTLTEPFSIGKGDNFGLIQLLQVPFMGLEEGDELRLEEEIIIAASPDVSAITDIIFSEAPILQGRVAAGDRTARCISTFQTARHSPK